MGESSLSDIAIDNIYVDLNLDECAGRPMEQ